MNSIDEIRKELIGGVKTFLSASYPSLLVNWPNKFIVDPEKQTTPYVQVELTFSGQSEPLDSGASNMIVRGNLMIYYLYPAGTGGNGSTAFSDAVKNAFCFKSIGKITMKGLAIVDVDPFPGIVGQMNALAFMI